MSAMTMTREENRAIAAATQLIIHHVFMVDKGANGVPIKGTTYRSLLDNLQSALERAAKVELRDNPEIPDDVPES